jgi:hypothetical protein
MTTSCEISETCVRYEQPSNPAASQEANSLEKLHQRYEEQQRRLACPACGEEPFLD